MSNHLFDALFAPHEGSAVPFLFLEDGRTISYGVFLERSGQFAHALTAPFIITENYGTRCSTVVRADSDGRWRFQERRFDAAGQSVGERHYSFRVGVDAQ